MKKPRTLTPEERAIWRESNRHTTKLQASVADDALPEALAPKRAGAPRPATHAAQPIASIATPSRIKPTKPPLVALPTREATKRLKLHPTIEATLDLHGLSRLEAHERVLRFITRQQQAGLRHVIIITGKGRGSEMGLLRRSLPDWLNEAPLRNLIASISHARPEKGGTGVTHVLLKRP